MVWIDSRGEETRNAELLERLSAVRTICQAVLKKGADICPCAAVYEGLVDVELSPQQLDRLDGSERGVQQLKTAPQSGDCVSCLGVRRRSAGDEPSVGNGWLSEGFDITS